MSEEFSGGITGTDVASHVRVARNDGANTFSGVERVTWTVVAGSGTGELAGLRGEGEFTVALVASGGPLSTYTFTSWFEDGIQQQKSPSQ